MEFENGEGVRKTAVRVALALIITATGLLLSIAASLAYDGLKDCADLRWDQTLTNCVRRPSELLLWRFGLALALSAVCVALSVLAIPVVRSALWDSVARVHQRGGKLSGVIFALSYLGGYAADKAGLPLRGEAMSKTTKWTADAIDRVTRLPGAPSVEEQLAVLDELCNPKGSWRGWSWQQPLRVLRHNHGEHGKLRFLCAILSREAQDQFPAFRRIVEPLLPPGAELTRVEGAVSRDDYNDLTRGLGEAVGLAGKKGLRLSDLCIDVTGGTAIYSAAALVKTLNSGMKLSYVRTLDAGNEGEVVIFDAAITG